MQHIVFYIHLDMEMYKNLCTDNNNKYTNKNIIKLENVFVYCQQKNTFYVNFIDMCLEMELSINTYLTFHADYFNNTKMIPETIKKWQQFISSKFDLQKGIETNIEQYKLFGIFDTNQCMANTVQNAVNAQNAKLVKIFIGRQPPADDSFWDKIFITTEIEVVNEFNDFIFH